jgi:hypothetical protein
MARMEYQRRVGKSTTCGVNTLDLYKQLWTNYREAVGLQSPAQGRRATAHPGRNVEQPSFTPKALHRAHGPASWCNPFGVNPAIWTGTQGAPLRGDPGLWNESPSAIADATHGD